MLQLLSQLPLHVTSVLPLLAALGVCLLIAVATGGNFAACVCYTVSLRRYCDGIVTHLLFLLTLSLQCSHYNYSLWCWSM